MNEKILNIAFVDGQNLYLGTRDNGWSIDHTRFRIYLAEKYHVKEAYYFIGYMTEKERDLYRNLERAGFILLFKEHSLTLRGNKKGNVDSDIIFQLMKKLVDQEVFSKAFIVSGDGDYKKLVDYLIKKNKFGKMLFPNKQYASSLYQVLGSEFFDCLEDRYTKGKIEYVRK